MTSDFEMVGLRSEVCDLNECQVVYLFMNAKSIYMNAKRTKLNLNIKLKRMLYENSCLMSLDNCSNAVNRSTHNLKNHSEFDLLEAVIKFITLKTTSYSQIELYLFLKNVLKYSLTPALHNYYIA